MAISTADGKIGSGAAFILPKRQEICQFFGRAVTPFRVKGDKCSISWYMF